MAKNEFYELDILRSAKTPAPDEAAKARALAGAMAAFDAAEKISPAAQGSADGTRLTDRTIRFWREMMQKKLVAAPALAGLVALPVAGYVGWQVMEEFRLATAPGDGALVETKAPERQRVETPQAPVGEAETGERGIADTLATQPRSEEPALLNGAPRPASRDMQVGGSALSKHLAVPAAPPIIAPEPYITPEDRERFERFGTNPVRSALESPVSTFSIDVDTASYAFARRSLKEGFLPERDSVRVEEMINYFPYDWAGPSNAEVPFNTTVTVTPTPWDADTRLMHVAIKGYDIQQTEKPRSNLVFLIDTSGSMSAADKLPLLKNSFRLLVERLEADDTVSIVTYAGNAGTVLEPTKVSDKGKILAALDRLEAGGRTAGEAGITEAYRLAEESFVKDGVNRIMLATDGDFNVGQTSDEALKRLVEEKRKSGVYLSVLGFGRGNLNDAMMQTIAQNGNGVAAYIDTLAEAEKVLVEEASSSLFTIASDVKIQVEFNPARVAEYRLIGYETRALNREDFNNDKVDAGDIGSGHTVTAIYEITPVGSPARMIDDLRYGEAGQGQGQGQGVANADEYAFVKIRYKTPGEETSKLIETPVTDANAVSAFAEAGEDLRFSVAVAAFGQKLRGTDALADYGYDKVMEIAAAARGADPFGYRAEFLSLVRLASALDGTR
ncbi:MAG: VWA domain-containing protein [Aquamicrobium sp.]|uniref:vWA domain-containing protein n=1 Tax=Aquamicrobium sp. TaxID=1872579 RepID=UPI00349EA9F5|nr:VWA domain-containing protein [Aquamicrobium sp.]